MKRQTDLKSGFVKTSTVTDTPSFYSSACQHNLNPALSQDELHDENILLLNVTLLPLIQGRSDVLKVTSG